ncbi:MAG: DHH family phosphoesterase [Thermoleophilia bacterium]|nr:DHH family phosphoesterase [Thermoleophilia bacterium]
MDSSAWTATPFSWELAERFHRELNVPLVVGIVLAARGFRTAGEIQAFIDVDPDVPDPFLFAHMEQVTALLRDAVDSGRRVVVHGDYDVDGISAAALMVRGLADLGLEAEAYLPSRFAQGYGLSRTAVEEIAAAGDALLVTVDCGVNYPEEVALARSLGLDVVVTDHHQLAGPRPSARPSIQVWVTTRARICAGWAWPSRFSTHCTSPAMAIRATGFHPICASISIWWLWAPWPIWCP